VSGGILRFSNVTASSLLAPRMSCSLSPGPFSCDRRPLATGKGGTPVCLSEALFCLLPNTTRIRSNEWPQHLRDLPHASRHIVPFTTASE